MEGERQKLKFDNNNISWDSIPTLMPATTWDVLCLLVILPHLSKCCSDAVAFTPKIISPGLLKCDKVPELKDTSLNIEWRARQFVID